MSDRSAWLRASAGTLGVLLVASAVYVFAQEKRVPESAAARDLRDQVALAEAQVAIKRAAVKVAVFQKKIAAAKVASARALVAEAQANEAFTEKQYKRFLELVKARAVAAEEVNEHRLKWEVARARRVAAESEVVQLELQVGAEEARVEMAEAELAAAELRVKQLKARLDGKG
jgi:multidrug resistance efflux pump